MKIKTLFSIFFCLIIFSSSAQDCEGYFPFSEGVTFEISNFDKKGKKNSRTVYKVLELANDNQIAKYEMEMFDQKDESMMTSNFEAACTEDGIIVDAAFLMSPDMMQSYSSMELDITGDNLAYPKALSVGQTLPDANLNVGVQMTPIQMNIKVNVYNRKVEGQESVTTSAGTFDCYIITFESETKAGIKVKSSSKQWIALNVGIIKEEYYNKSGKLLGSSQLTAYSN